MPSRSVLRYLLGFAIVVGACGSEGAPTLPSGLQSVWVVDGSTDSPPLHETTYFNDAPAPRLQAGETWVTWTCSGKGVLVLRAVRVGRPGPVPPPTAPAGLTVQLQCPSAVPRWIRLSQQALGGEDALVIQPVSRPSEAIRYRVELLQPGAATSSGG